MNATSVGSNFLFDAQISVMLVARVKKYNHQICMPNISNTSVLSGNSRYEIFKSVNNFVILHLKVRFLTFFKVWKLKNPKNTLFLFIKKFDF